MSQKNIHQLKPFASVLIIISTLFAVVILQMEERRVGYGVLKLTRDYRKASEERRSKEVQLAKVTRPQLLDQLAKSKFTLKKIESKQIVLLSEVKVEAAESLTTNSMLSKMNLSKRKIEPVLASKENDKKDL
jgi:hypothetical protein